MANNNTTIHLFSTSIPNDVSCIIFSDLSIKQLHLSKRVCKEWKAFIESTGFVKAIHNKHYAYQKWDYELGFLNIKEIMFLKNNPLISELPDPQPYLITTNHQKSIIFSASSFQTDSEIREIKLDTLTSKRLATSQGQFTCLCYHNQKLYAAEHNHLLQIDIETVSSKDFFDSSKQSIFCLIASEQLLYSGNLNGSIEVWNLDTLKKQDDLIGHKGEITSLLYDPSFGLISGSTDKEIHIFHGKDCFFLSGHTQAVKCLALHQKKLYSGSDDKTLKVWDLDKRTCEKTFNFESGISCLTRIGNALILGCQDGTIYIWDTFEETTLRSFKEKTASITGLYIIDSKIIVLYEGSSFICDFSLNYSLGGEDRSDGHLSSREKEPSNFSGCNLFSIFLPIATVFLLI